MKTVRYSLQIAIPALVLALAAGCTPDDREADSAAQPEERTEVSTETGESEALTPIEIDDATDTSRDVSQALDAPSAIEDIGPADIEDAVNIVEGFILYELSLPPTYNLTGSEYAHPDYTAPGLEGGIGYYVVSPKHQIAEVEVKMQSANFTKNPVKPEPIVEVSVEFDVYFRAFNADVREDGPFVETVPFWVSFSTGEPLILGSYGGYLQWDFMSVQTALTWIDTIRDNPDNADLATEEIIRKIEGLAD